MQVVSSFGSPTTGCKEQASKGSPNRNDQTDIQPLLIFRVLEIDGNGTDAQIGEGRQK